MAPVTETSSGFTKPTLKEDIKIAVAMRRLFSRIVYRYDLTNRVITWGQDQRWRRFAVRLASPREADLVLDIATGTADLALAFARQGEQVIALDICPEMLALGGDKVQKAGLGKKVLFLLGDALRLPFPDSTFNIVSCGFALRNISRLPNLFQEIKRVLQPGGRFVCLEASPPDGGLMALFHRFYLRRVVPRLGLWLTRDKEAYRYLANSISRFTPAQAVRNLLEPAGLHPVGLYTLGWGAAMAILAIRTG